MFRKKYRIWYYAKDKDNKIPFSLDLKATSLDNAKKKFEKLALKYENKNKDVKYELIKIEVEE